LGHTCVNAAKSSAVVMQTSFDGLTNIAEDYATLSVYIFDSAAWLVQ